MSLLTLLLGTLGQVSLVANVIQFTGNFESGDLTEWRFSGNTTPQVVEEPVRSGEYSVSVTVGPDDEVPYRSELVMAANKGDFIEHEEYWISLSFFIEDWGAVLPSWATILQIRPRPHQLPDGSGPDWDCSAGKNPISISTKGSKLSLNVVKNPDQTQLPGSAAIATEVWSEGLEVGVWQDWTFRYRSSAEEDGIIEAWKDGEKIYEQYGANRYLLDNCNEPATPTTYLKVGIYRDKANTSIQKLFMDEVHIYAGTNGYDEVQPPAMRVVDTERPSTPSGLVSSSITETSFTVSWSPATDNVGVSEYTVYVDGQKVKTVETSSARFIKQAAGTTYNISVEATDQEGNVSSRSSILTVSTLAEAVPVTPPPVPSPTPVAEPVSPFVPITTTPKQETIEPVPITPSESVFIPSASPTVTPQQKVPPPRYSQAITNEERSAAINNQTSESATTTIIPELATSTAAPSSPPEVIAAEPLPLPVKFYCYVMNVILSIFQSDLRCRQATEPAD